jgi:RNA polymerase sigma-70 factor (ECF subfamily)
MLPDIIGRMNVTVTRPMKSSANQHDRRARMVELFTAHAADVYAFALRRSSPSTAEDVVSETFLVAWRRLDSVPDTPKPWLLAVARRVLANQRRSNGRQSALRSRLGVSHLDTWRAGEVELSGDAAVLGALAELAPAERDGITLIAWDGLTAQEAAIGLGCSRSTFYVRFHRAKKRLAAVLAIANDTHEVQEADQP